MDKSKKKQKCSDSIFKKTLDPPCEEYLSEKQALDSVQKGTSLKGKIRVNPKNYQHAYIDNPSGGQDILIESAQNRNRAFSNDIVVVQLLREDQWKVRLHLFYGIMTTTCCGELLWWGELAQPTLNGIL
jgi:DIS3-like exonuclease 2